MSTQTKKKMKKAPATYTISSERGNEYLREVLTMSVGPRRGILAHKLRIRIKLDPYAIQCYARVALWDGSQWQPLHGIHYAHMATRHTDSAPQKEIGLFADREELIRIAAEVLA